MNRIIEKVLQGEINIETSTLQKHIIVVTFIYFIGSP